VLIQEQGYEKLKGLLDVAAEIKAQAECTAPGSSSSNSSSSRMSVKGSGTDSDTDRAKVVPSLFIASISPQTAASFANAISSPGRPCSAAEAFLRLAALFKHMGFTYVFDTRCACFSAISV
jgi:hypothetical protein